MRVYKSEELSHHLIIRHAGIRYIVPIVPQGWIFRLPMNDIDKIICHEMLYYSTEGLGIPVENHEERLADIACDAETDNNGPDATKIADATPAALERRLLCLAKIAGEGRDAPKRISHLMAFMRENTVRGIPLNADGLVTLTLIPAGMPGGEASVWAQLITSPDFWQLPPMQESGHHA